MRLPTRSGHGYSGPAPTCSHPTHSFGVLTDHISVDGDAKAEFAGCSAIDEVGGRIIEVGEHLGFDLRLEPTQFDRSIHVRKPGITFGLTDGERVMTHTQTGMASLLAVGGGSTPVLNKETRHVGPRLCQILWVERSDQFVGFDAIVETIDQLDEPRLAADDLIEAGHYRTFRGSRRRCCRIISDLISVDVGVAGNETETLVQTVGGFA